MMRFSDLAEPINEQCDPAECKRVVYVGLEHIDSGALWLSRFGKPADVQSSKSRFKRGDILYGKLRPYLDKAVLLDRDGICSTDILVFRPKTNACPAFIVALIHSSAFLSHAVSTTHGVNHPRTSWGALSEFEWEVPRKGEQERIAAVLWMLQKAIEVQDKLVRTTRELKQAAMRKLFTHGLRNEPVKETEIGLVPESWGIRPFAELREFLQYGTSTKCDYSRKGNPVIRIPNVLEGTIDSGDIKWCELTEKATASFLLQSGDVMFIRTNGVRERVGSCAIYRGQPEDALFASYLIRARLKRGTTKTNEEELDPDFFQFYCNTIVGKSFLAGRSSPAADGKFNINTMTIDSVLVPLPSPAEQGEVVHILQTLERKIELHEKRRAALQDLFRTLLQKLMTAQIRVHKLDIETSEVAA